MHYQKVLKGVADICTYHVADWLTNPNTDKLFLSGKTLTNEHDDSPSTPKSTTEIDDSAKASPKNESNQEVQYAVAKNDVEWAAAFETLKAEHGKEVAKLQKHQSFILTKENFEAATGILGFSKEKILAAKSKPTEESPRELKNNLDTIQRLNRRITEVKTENQELRGLNKQLQAQLQEFAKQEEKSSKREEEFQEALERIARLEKDKRKLSERFESLELIYQDSEQHVQELVARNRVTEEPELANEESSDNTKYIDEDDIERVKVEELDDGEAKARDNTSEVEVVDKTSESEAEAEAIARFIGGPARAAAPLPEAGNAYSPSSPSPSSPLNLSSSPLSSAPACLDSQQSLEISKEATIEKETITPTTASEPIFSLNPESTIANASTSIALSASNTDFEFGGAPSKQTPVQFTAGPTSPPKSLYPEALFEHNGNKNLENDEKPAPPSKKPDTQTFSSAGVEDNVDSSAKAPPLPTHNLSLGFATTCAQKASGLEGTPPQEKPKMQKTREEWTEIVRKEQALQKAQEEETEKEKEKAKKAEKVAKKAEGGTTMTRQARRKAERDEKKKAEKRR